MRTAQHFYLPTTLGNFLLCFTSAKSGGYEIEAKLMEEAMTSCGTKIR
jgi:hypothetical protein